MTNALQLTISLLLGAVFVTLAAVCYWKQFVRLHSGHGEVQDSWFRRGDLIFALMLTAWFATSAVSGFLIHENERVVDSGRIIDGGLMFVIIVAFILVFTIKRQTAKGFGFFTIGPVSILWRSLLFLLAAYPLILVGGIITKLLSRGEQSSQAIVQYFMSTEDPTSRLVVILMAVLLAPIAEEIIFRGYLYGVFKKYMGFRASLIVTSLLFAIVHLHLPSIGILLVLALCLTLAYEASGSIWVPMTMHALFNSVSLGVMLMAPELVP